MLFTVSSVVYGIFNNIHEKHIYTHFPYIRVYIFPLYRYIQKTVNTADSEDSPHYQNGTSSCVDSVKPLGISTFSAIMHTQFDSIPAILVRRVRLCASVHSLPCLFAHDKKDVGLKPAFDSSFRMWI